MSRRKSAPRAPENTNAEWIQKLAAQLAGLDFPEDRPGLKFVHAFVTQHRSGQVPDKFTLENVATAFEKILAGADAEKALGIKRSSRGAPRTPAMVLRDTTILLRLIQLRAHKVPRLDAIEKAASEYGVGFEIVERIYKRYVAGATYYIGADGSFGMNSPKGFPVRIGGKK